MKVEYIYTVYVLFSEKHDRHYTGFSSDLIKRLISHNELGKKDWAARYRPWKIIYTKEFSDKKEAIKYENWLKTGIGRKYINSLPH